MEIFAIAALILLNGVFAMSEIAVLASRPIRLQHLSKRGVRSAGVALGLHNAPNTFLSTIQVGITLIGVSLGAIGEATLTDNIVNVLKQYESVAPYSTQIAFIIVIVTITYFSLVIGELVPKRLALLRAERIACAVAPSMRVLARVTRPAVRLLSLSVETVLRILRIKPSVEPSITEEEIHAAIEEGARGGVLLKTERELLKNVMRLADRSIGTLMCLRTDIIWLDLDDAPDENRRKISASPHSRFPVARGNLDNVLGIVQAKDFLAHLFAGGGMELDTVMRPVLRVSAGMSRLKLLEIFRSSPVHIALVTSAAGEVRGLVTLHDLLEAMVGELPGEGEMAEPEIVRREDGSFLLDGMLSLVELKETLGLENLPEDTVGYEAVAGFILARVGHVPKMGEYFEWDKWCFEVVDMDGNRIDRVLATPLKNIKKVES